jgi:hypothetical protein
MEDLVAMGGGTTKNSGQESIESGLLKELGLVNINESIESQSSDRKLRKQNELSQRFVGDLTSSYQTNKF